MVGVMDFEAGEVGRGNVARGWRGIVARFENKNVENDIVNA